MKLFLLFLIVNSIFLTRVVRRKSMKRKARRLGLTDSGVDVRATLNQKEKDNPLSELWDINHIKVARQKLNMNLNMPMNRLKLHLSKDYQVKIIVHNDEDYNALRKYFYPPK